MNRLTQGSAAEKEGLEFLKRATHEMQAALDELKKQNVKQQKQPTKAKEPSETSPAAHPTSY